MKMQDSGNPQLLRVAANARVGGVDFRSVEADLAEPLLENVTPGGLVKPIALAI